MGISEDKSNRLAKSGQQRTCRESKSSPAADAALFADKQLGPALCTVTHDGDEPAALRQLAEKRVWERLRPRR